MCINEPVYEHPDTLYEARLCARDLFGVHINHCTRLMHINGPRLSQTINEFRTRFAWHFQPFCSGVASVLQLHCTISIGDSNSIRDSDIIRVRCNIRVL